MKRIIREILVSSLSLYLTVQFIDGLKIYGGINAYLIAGVLFLLGDYILKPILDIITLPFKLLTFGLFSIAINSIVLYIITLFYPSIKVTDFVFNGINYQGFNIPSFHIPTLLSYFVISAIIHLIKRLISWLLTK